jgi:hypothetical protein
MAFLVSITTHLCGEYVAKVGERRIATCGTERNTEDAVTASRDAK